MWDTADNSLTYGHQDQLWILITKHLADGCIKCQFEFQNEDVILFGFVSKRTFGDDEKFRFHKQAKFVIPNI